MVDDALWPWGKGIRLICTAGAVLQWSSYVVSPPALAHWFDRLDWLANTVTIALILYAWWGIGGFLTKILILGRAQREAERDGGNQRG